MLGIAVFGVLVMSVSAAPDGIVLKAILEARQNSSDAETYCMSLPLIPSSRLSTPAKLSRLTVNSVCLPAVTTGTIPPCQEINNIEATCLPNGTTPLALLAHAQCMCGGSYFADWIGCLDCNFVHGARSPAITSAFHSILTTVSNQLCTGTPAAPFQSIFKSLNYDMGPSNATGAATQMSDMYPSQTAVSLYYTATSQGPGAITGSATAATKSVASVATSPSKTVSGTTGGSSKSTTAGGAIASTTKSSTAGAAATGAWLGGFGLAAGLVGMAVL